MIKPKLKIFNPYPFESRANLTHETDGPAVKYLLAVFLLLVPAYRWLAIVSNVVASDIAFLFVLLALMLRLSLKSSPFKLDKFFLLLVLALLSIWSITLLLATDPSTGLDNIAQNIFLLVIFYFFSTRPFQLKDLDVLFWGGSLFAIFAVGELILGPILEGGSYGFGSRFIREATHPQIIVSALFPLSIMRWADSKKNIYALHSLILYLLLIFSFSRGGLIAIHLILFFMLFNKKTRATSFKSWGFISLVILALRSIIGPEYFVHFFLRVGSIFALGQDREIDGYEVGAEHAADRLSLIKTTVLNGIDGKMFFGHGLDSFVSDVSNFGGPWIAGDDLAKMSPHNLPSMIFYEQGLVGCFIFLFFLSFLLFRLTKTRSYFSLKYGFIFSIIALLINSNTDPGVIVERITWVVLGMATSYCFKREMSI